MLFTVKAQRARRGDFALIQYLQDFFGDLVSWWFPGFGSGLPGL
jgi:hypothetical protein